MRDIMDMDEKWDDLHAEQDSAEREEKQQDLMYLFLDETDMDVDEVYSLVFMGGKKISWQ